MIDPYFLHVHVWLRYTVIKKKTSVILGVWIVAVVLTVVILLFVCICLWKKLSLDTDRFVLCHRYQFNPGYFQTEIAALILLKALTNLPHTDFILCKCLIDSNRVSFQIVFKPTFKGDSRGRCQLAWKCLVYVEICFLWWFCQQYATDHRSIFFALDLTSQAVMLVCSFTN